MRIDFTKFEPLSTTTAPSPPARIGDGDWNIQATGTGLEASISILAVPVGTNNIVYDIDGDGVERSLGTNQTGAQIISLPVNDMTYAIRLKPQTASGGTWSASKNVTLVTSASAPDQFAVSDWTLADAGSGGMVVANIVNLSADNGAVITDIEYQVDGGSWTSSGAATTTSFLISGLTNGQQYNIGVRAVNSAGSGLASAEKSAVPTTASHSATIVLSERSALQVAPEALYFEVLLSGFDSTGPIVPEVYDNRLHEVYYYWDFYATGSDSDESYTYQHLTKTPTQFRNSRYGFGARASHTYRIPGTYRVSCTAVEPASGKTSTDTLDVVIGNPDTVFTADNQTIIVGPAWATYPNATVVSTLAAAKDAILAFSDQTTPRRVIVRRNQTFSSAGAGFGGGSTWPSTHWLAADEAGTLPVINMTGPHGWYHGSAAYAKDWIWQDLILQGGWDSTTETGTKFNGFELGQNPPKQFLLDNVILRDFGERTIQTIETNMTTHPYKMFFNDSYLDGWRKYGMYLASVNIISLAGTKIEHDPLANAGGPDTGNLNYNGPFRLANGGSLSTAVFHSCELYSRTSWFQRGGIWGAQPPIRFDTSGQGGGTLLVHCSVIEGGEEQITLDSHVSNRRINAVVAQNYLMATHITTRSLNIQKAGVTFRNNIFVFPNTPEYTLGSGYVAAWFLRAASDGEIAGQDDDPINFYNNTLINLLTHSVGEYGNGGGFTNVDVANNAVYEPNLGSPNIVDGPFSSTQLFTPTELGYKHNASYGDGQDVLQTAYATPAASAWEAAPLAGAGVLGDATTGTIAYDDFYGNARPQYPSRGALEIAS